jgi:hypothetical protein
MAAFYAECQNMLNVVVLKNVVAPRGRCSIIKDVMVWFLCKLTSLNSTEYESTQIKNTGSSIKRGGAAYRLVLAPALNRVDPSFMNSVAGSYLWLPSRHLNKVNCTAPSPSVSIPWTDTRQSSLFCCIFYHPTKWLKYLAR